MANITSANAAQAIAALVASEALPALVGNLILGNLVNRDYEDTLSQHGQSVNVPIPPVMVANNLAEGGNVTTQNPNLGNATITLNKHKESSFTLPDITRALANPDLIKMYMQPAVIAIAEAIEGDLLGLYASFTANSPVGAGGSPLTESTVDAAETALFKAKVPPSAQKYLVVSADAYSALRQVQRFSEYQTAAESGVNALINGVVAKVKDFFVFRSQYVKVTGSAPATTHNLAFAKDAMALVVRPLGTALPGTGAVQHTVSMGNFALRVTLSYNPQSLAQQFSVDVLYGVGALRNNFCVQVDS